MVTFAGRLHLSAYPSALRCLSSFLC